MRRTLTVLIAAVLLAGLTAAPASATIHELVGSHCSFDHRGNLEPPGQTPTSFDFDQSDLRALLATGIYDENTVQIDPTTTPLPTVTIVPANIDHPASKFSWDGVTFIGPFPVDIDGDGVDDIQVLLPLLVADHPSLSNCKNLR